MPAKGDAVPAGDHVLRYIRRKHVDQGNVTGSGFLPRPGEGHPSVNWMECFDLPIENQLDQIRAEKRIKYEKRSKLVRLNTVQAADHIQTEAAIALGFIYDPEDATEQYCAHMSHSYMTGVPEETEPLGELVGDLLRECIVGEYEPIPD